MSRIGTSDLNVYPLALGGNTFGWTSDATMSHRVLDAFVIGGGNFIDTADLYSAWAPGNAGGESETIIGGWMAGRGNRAQVIIGTKVSQHPQFRGLGAANIMAAAEASLARLQTDYIDLYYAHFDDEKTPLEETLRAFNDLVVAGKVRYLGVSNYSAVRLNAWLAIAKREGYALPIALQPHYSLVHRQPFERELLPVVAANHLSVIPYWVLAAGFLTGKYRSVADIQGTARAHLVGTHFNEAGLAVVTVLADIASSRHVALATVALAWIMSKPCQVAPLASARTPEQLVDLMAASRLTLNTEEVARLDAVSAGIPE